MATIPLKRERSTSSIILKTIIRSPFLSGIATYIAFNFLSVILLGGFTELALLTNLFPGVMGFFLSLMYNEPKQKR